MRIPPKSLHIVLRDVLLTAAGPTLLCFGTVSCTDGMLNSGADFGSKITDNHTVDTATELPEESDPISGTEFPTDIENETDSTADTQSPSETESETDTPRNTDTDEEWLPRNCGPYYALPKLVESTVCWYISGISQSCTETCAYHGGLNPDTPRYIGSESEGGSVDDCNEILWTMWIRGFAPAEGILSVDGQGLGCYHVFTQNLHYWVQDVPFDPNAKAFDIQRVCGCMGDQGTS